ncbi:MAG: DedA family protein [Dehalococcoidia bacterium]|nr:DedA family protein [Dehalococcoidia bacterium]
MGEIEHQILLFISNVYDATGWYGVVLMMAIESACIPLPSEVIMPLSGWMLIQAKGLSIWWTLLAGFYGALGCTIGSILAYWAGALGGRPFVDRFGKFFLVSHHDIALAERWFAKYGDWAAFISRLLPVVRTFVSFPAGIARMNFPKFVLFSFLGSFPWCFALALGGFFLGENWENLRSVMRPFDIPIIGIILILAAIYVYRHLKKDRPAVAE